MWLAQLYIFPSYVIFLMASSIYCLTSNGWPDVVKQIDTITVVHLIARCLIWLITIPLDFFPNFLPINSLTNGEFFTTMGIGFLLMVDRLFSWLSLLRCLQVRLAIACQNGIYWLGILVLLLLNFQKVLERECSSSSKFLHLPTELNLLSIFHQGRLTS